MKLVARGDTTRILHASAAVGDAVYVGQGLRSEFKFALRTTDTGAVQRAYLAEHRWVATNQAMSRTDREMQIDLELLDRTNRRLALGLYRMPGDSSIAWPAGLADGCTATKTVQGYLPPSATFEREKWVRLILE